MTPGSPSSRKPLDHLAGGLVGERDDEHLVRRHGLGRDGVRRPPADDAGLARARGGQDDDRPLDRQDGLPLRVVQVVEEARRIEVSDRTGHVVSIAPRAYPPMAVPWPVGADQSHDGLAPDRGPLAHALLLHMRLCCICPRLHQGARHGDRLGVTSDRPDMQPNGMREGGGGQVRQVKTLLAGDLPVTLSLAPVALSLAAGWRLCPEPPVAPASSRRSPRAAARPPRRGPAAGSRPASAGTRSACRRRTTGGRRS